MFPHDADKKADPDHWIFQMDSNDFLLLSLAVTGIALLISICVSTTGNSTDDKHTSAGWKKFTVRPGVLNGGGDQRALVSGLENGSGELEILSGNIHSFPIKIGHHRRGLLMVIEKPRRSLKSSIRISLLGQPWVQIRPGRKKGIPRLVGAGTRMSEEIPDAGSIRIEGDIASREYEIRVREKLAAAIFQDEEPGDGFKTDGSYRVALPEGLPELPFLALVVGIEVDMAVCGNPARALTLEA